MRHPSRRRFLTSAALAGSALASGLALPRASHRLLVIGGGAAGIAAAAALRSAAPGARVTLVERDPARLARETGAPAALMPPAPVADYAALAGAGIELLLDDVTGLDWQAARAELFSGRREAFDRVVLAPGVAAADEGIAGLDARTRHLWPAAWGSAREAARLAAQLTALPDRGRVVLRLPAETGYAPTLLAARAQALAATLAAVRPAARLLVLDADRSAAAARAFAARATGAELALTDWQMAEVTGVDADAGRLETSAGTVRADVVNFVPAFGAGLLAQAAGLTDASGWCPCDETLRSTLRPGAVIAGDARRDAIRGLDAAGATGRLSARAALA